MAMWLYQMNQQRWPPNSYRLEIWEGERWNWPVGRLVGADEPQIGDVLVFFYAPSGGVEPGFYGWALILEWEEGGKERRVHFRTVAPSDHLKMHPWWDKEAERLAREVRGSVKQGTMWQVEGRLAREISAGITRWLAGTRETPVPGGRG